ncbi:MAG: methyltransferase [Proteobacteria bacterium]|nr:methyltransferase [Pseudomonadota bacterium]
MVARPKRVKARRRLDKEADTTTDALLDGRLALRQPRNGYRAGLDAALLAAAVEAHAGERLVEAGCGVGAALLQSALRSPQARFVGVERDPAALALARENLAANALDGRVEALGGDVDEGFRALALPLFDAAFSNPPFFDDPGALRAPHPSRHAAWMADGGLASWTRFLLKAVREGGRITVVHRADRLADILALLGETAGSFRVRPVHPFIDAPAKRVLVRAVKTGRAPLVLLPPLVLQERGAGAWRPEVDAILRGASLPWGV